MICSTRTCRRRSKPTLCFPLGFPFASSLFAPAGIRWITGGAPSADELRPDLILLDIGLPGLNGIAAAHEIRKLAPKTKIIFVTQESSADVVQVALATGAAGYIVKTDGNQLLAAVDEALAGIVRTEGHDAKVEPSRATKLLAVSVSLWLAR